MATNPVTINKIKFWINKGWNVMISGKHGCGKTSLIKQACEELGLEFGKDVVYFSGSTLDPCVDFSGIPTKVQKENGDWVLKFIYPEWIANDQVQVIIIDEYNRAHKKVRNATMELIQFRSINGKKLNNLKCIVTAINPYDEEGSYNVEELDGAQKDRFWIQVNAPYIPDPEYFSKKFGPENAEGAISWWKNLDETIKNEVSPRRLDIALEVFLGGGDLNDVLPSNCNITALKKNLHGTPAIVQLRTFAKENKFEEMRKWLAVPEHYHDVKKEIVSDVVNYNLYIPYVPEENLSQLINSEKTIRQFVLNNEDKIRVFNEILNNILKVKGNKEVVDEIEFFRKNKVKSYYEVNGKVSKADANIESYVTENCFNNLLEKIPSIVAKDEKLSILESLPKKISKSISPYQSEKALAVLDSAVVIWGKSIFISTRESMLPVINKLVLCSLDGDSSQEIVCNLLEKHKNILRIFLSVDGFCIKENAKTEDSKKNSINLEEILI